MRPLFGIAVTSDIALNSSQCGRLNCQTLIPGKDRGNPIVPFNIEPGALKQATIEPPYVA
jgi:hypothetical protein